MKDIQWMHVVINQSRRGQSTLFPAILEDRASEDELVLATDDWVENLEMKERGFQQPENTGRVD